MTQYCRYCANMVCGDANYCTVKSECYSDSLLCRANKCGDFEFNAIDALGTGRLYSARVQPAAKSEQIRIEVRE